jgi:hypothetical protein
MAVPNLNDICDCCGGYENQPFIQLFNDKCFKIVDQKDITGEFCLADVSLAVDGYTCIGLRLESSGGTLTLFDNQVIINSPSQILESEKEYVRGILLKITYPIYDNNSEEIALTAKSVKISIERASDMQSLEYPLHNLFIMFMNPKSNDPEDLINKIEIINPNVDYIVKVSALVLFGKAD